MSKQGDTSDLPDMHLTQGADDATIRVKELALAWQDAREKGEATSVEAICAGDTNLIPAVRAWLDKVGAMEAMLATQAPTAETLKGSWAQDNILTAPQAPDELGRLGGYRILKLIGQGGMGKVYLAEDVNLKRRVAVKVLLQGGDKRFLREAQTLAKVDHDHIVTVYQLGEERGVHYLAMPYLQGETLEARLKRIGRPPLAESIRIAKQITQGLAAAHKHGVIHRDIKPSNIWLEAGSDRVKILDFGLARSSEAETVLTQEGTVVGTPAFMAPEQAQGKTVDHRADLFSLGCVLYQLISGVSPFARKDILSTLRALEMDTPEEPSVLAPETAGPLSKLAMQLLEKKPENRPTSAAAVLEVLDGVEKNLTSVASAPTALEMPVSPVKRDRRRHMPIFGAIGIASLLAIGFLVWRAQRTADEEQPQGAKDKQVAVAPPVKVDLATNDRVPAIGVQPPVGTSPIDLKSVDRRDFKLKVELPNVKQDEDFIHRLTAGEPVKFKIEVEENAYVGIWYLFDDGAVLQLFPNEFDSDHFFKKGQTYVLPRDDKYEFSPEPSRKLEKFRVRAFTNKWDWDRNKAEGGYRKFADAKEFNETMRGMSIVANKQNSERVSELWMPVWVSGKK